MCARDEDARLSPRQRQVLQLAWDGWDVKGTARALGLSPATVKNYRAMIYRKFEVGGVEGMLRQGVERGLIRVARVMEADHVRR